jgi:hypothetical protein
LSTNRSGEISDIKAADAAELLAASRPQIVTFLGLLEADANPDTKAITTVDFHVAQFPEGEDRLSIQQLRSMVGECELNNEFHSNSVAVTIFYKCPNGSAPRLVFNFRRGKISRVLAGFLEPMRVEPNAIPER